MLRPLTRAALGIAALALSTATAQAAESLESCAGFITSLPVTLTTQGVWCMDRDLSTNLASGNAITVATNNVILDCNHYKLGNLSAGPGTTAAGVGASNRLNATVRNCNIRGFYFGVSLVGAGHLVENNRFDGNTRYGISVFGGDSTIRGNYVVATGGSTAQAGSGFGIYVQGSVDILDNTINGVIGTSGNSNAFGIYGNVIGGASIEGNRVRGLAPAGDGVPAGIYTLGSGRGTIRGNNLAGPGPAVANGVGVRCDGNTATARDNVASGFATGVQGCSSSGNYTNPN